MKKDFGQAALDLHSMGIGGVLGTVDATVERGLAAKYGIKGYPTLKFFRHGEVIAEYNQGRSAADIVSYMKNTPNRKEEL